MEAPGRQYTKRNAHETERDQDFENDPSRKIEQSIYELGNDKTKKTSTAEEIDEVAQLILKDGSACPDVVVGSIVACLLELPNKTELICSVLGVLNVENRELVRLCLDRLNQHLSSSLDVKWWHLVQVPRIMIELTNTRVITSSVLDAFLLETCETLIGKSESGELTAMAVLLALPWLSSDLVTGLTNLGRVMQLLDELVRAEDRFSMIFKGVDVKIEGFEAFNGDALKALYQAVRSSSGVIVIEGRLEAYKPFEGALAASIGHADFTLNWSRECLESVPVIAEFKPLELFSDAFEGESAYSRIFYHFMLHQLVEAYELNHRRGAEVLFSCLPEAAVPEKMICQVLFGKLLRSHVRTSITYYEVLLIDSCRLSRMFPPMMARSLIKLVSQMSETEADLEVLERLAGWFAHHLSHYDFKWNWTEWKEIAESSEKVTCQRIFLRFLINRLLLLSYQEKMQAVIPDFMLKLMPSMSSAPKPSSNLNAGLLDYIKQKRPSVDEIREHVAREGISTPEVFEVFLVIGSKTFSHLSSATDRYSGLFQNLSPSDQSPLLDMLSAFWADNLQNFHLVIEKLIQHQVISVQVVLDWIFEKSTSEGEDFEVNLLLKYLSSDFLMDSLMPSGSVEKVEFLRNLIDRLASLNVNSSWPVKWLTEGLIRKFLRSFFADKSCFLVQKTETLIAMLQSSASQNYPENVKIMIEATLKSITI